MINLSGLARTLGASEPFAGLVPVRGPRRVYGLLAAARPALMAALAGNGQRPVLVIEPHPQQAHELAEQLRLWTELSVDVFPAMESLPYERVRLDRGVLAAREAVVQKFGSGDPQIAVAPVRALLQPVHGTGSIGESTIVRLGDELVVDHLASTWLGAGYAETSLVDEPGTFARRGGVVDIFPAGADLPVRIEFFGREVESLRSFDHSNQRSVGPVEHVSVPPLARMDSESRMAALAELQSLDVRDMTAEARTWWQQDLATLEAGASLDDLSVFLPYLIRRPQSLIDQLPSDCIVIVDDVERVWEESERLFDQAAELQSQAEDAGNLPCNLRVALLPPTTVRRQATSTTLIELVSGTGAESNDLDLTGCFVPAPAYTSRLSSLAPGLRAPGVTTIITSFQHERIGELLDQDGVNTRLKSGSLDRMPPPGVLLMPFSLATGWALPSEKLTLLTDYELFGRVSAPRKTRRARATREAFFTDFSTGDHVVHLEHGIGRFEGVARMSVDGAEREYALVQYAGTDRVYVPSDQLERLTRYIGVGDTPPRLNKLGGGEWGRARQRAKNAAEDIARELIDLYSKRAARPGRAFGPDTPWQHELESSFPFEETPDQLRALEEVKGQMEEPHPMDRLVCADVGYGKTEIAVRAAFKAVMDGSQVAVLVPTTILAQQHYETFMERFAAFPTTVEALSRFRSRLEQREILRRLQSGEVDVVIGTHRLLQKDVNFQRLGLLIIDEEQRFGVKHKEQLKKMRETIDVLTLTATPIPRTLHMGLVGIREISVIETPPEGRLPIKTFLQPFDERLLREAVLRELDRDGQVYIVHNKVASIDAMAERIRQLVPEARVLVGHGQMEGAQLERCMLSFAHREADVLLCSTIIENGLDIPNVNTIIVNNAHRLGLTQLYQLRGRVGRSANQAYAYLLYPRDVNLSHDAARRLEAVFEAQSLGAGFNIAMKDLEIRGAGNLLGAEQSGHATAIGFDLYTRMVSDAVERLKGIPVYEPAVVTVDVPLSRFLPTDFVTNEAERLSLYRSLAAVGSKNELDTLLAELRDRFGHLPRPVENLITSVGIKLRAIESKVSSISLDDNFLTMRTEPGGLYDRVALYRKYATAAKISTNVLRVPRHLLEPDWLTELLSILDDMVRLRGALRRPETAQAG